MFSFDTSIIFFFHQISLQFPQLSPLIVIIGDNNLCKGTVISVLVWWLWFQPSELSKIIRERMISTLIISGVSIVLARLLTHLLPFRVRPLANPEIGLTFPAGNEILETWSSFPSDHAILFFTIATGIYLCSRFLGSLAFFHSIVFVCLPRLYLGLHYPTDLLAGALIGVGMGLLGNTQTVRHLIVKPINILMKNNPSLFYVCFFLVTYQIADMFETSRALFKSLINLLH
jgi:undecaprenyl-diphosphatase